MPAAPCSPAEDPLAKHEWAHRLALPPRKAAFEAVVPEEMDAQMAAGGGGGAPDAPAAPAELFAEAGPVRAPGPQEYYSLPLAVKASILSRLCDHLLDCVTVRAEVDRRENEGMFVAGKGGAGGAFPVLTPEERAKAEARVSGAAGSSGMGSGASGLRRQRRSRGRQGSLWLLACDLEAGARCWL